MSAAKKTPLYVVLGAVALYCVNSALAVPAKGQTQPGLPPFVSLNTSLGTDVYRIEDEEHGVVCYLVPARTLDQSASVSCVAVPWLQK